MQTNARTCMSLMSVGSRPPSGSTSFVAPNPAASRLLRSSPTYLRANVQISKQKFHPLLHHGARKRTETATTYDGLPHERSFQMPR